MAYKTTITTGVSGQSIAVTATDLGVPEYLNINTGTWDSALPSFANRTTGTLTSTGLTALSGSGGTTYVGSITFPTGTTKDRILLQYHLTGTEEVIGTEMVSYNGATDTVAQTPLEGEIRQYVELNNDDIATANSTVSTINGKLGTPDGASVSDDIAAAKAVIDNTYTIVNTDIYTIKVGFGRDATNSRDEYSVTFLENGIELTSGITSPTITVRDTSNNVLINAQTLTQVGAEKEYKYWESTNRITLGEPYTAVIAATLNGNAVSISAKIARDKE